MGADLSRKTNEKADAELEHRREQMIKEINELGTKPDKGIYSWTERDIIDTHLKSGLIKFVLEIDHLAKVKELEKDRDHYKSLFLEAGQYNSRISELEATIDPVRHWYDGDGERGDALAMLKDAIADLQSDRKDKLKLEKELSEDRAHASDLEQMKGTYKRQRDAALSITKHLQEDLERLLYTANDAARYFERLGPEHNQGVRYLDVSIAKVRLALGKLTGA